MTPRINSDRLWDSLMQMARIGATPNGGCNRQALTDLDIQGRRLFADWCGAYGFEVSCDAVGNMFARMAGQDDALPPLVIGSHLDTQPTGGKFDGVLGVLAGLEVLRALAEAGLSPRRPVEVASWMNEEGARFAPAMMGSGVASGMLDLTRTRAIADRDGVTVGQELDRHGFSGLADPTAKPMAAYLELHIEQGPVLEREGKVIGIVTGAQGIRWYDLALHGQEVHAGPFPMSMRRDPVALLPRIISRVFAIGTRDDQARATIGQIEARPGSRNVVPSELRLTIDLRHPDENILTAMHEELCSALDELNAQSAGVTADLRLIWHSPVVAFDPNLISAVRQGVAKTGHSHLDIVSGAGHDALMIARNVPTTMIFIPCRGGLSHNEAEYAEKDHVVAGAEVLLLTALKYLE